MAKGDDAVRRKRNKANRKRLGKGTSTVSARVAAIIASKKRRQSGKRRKCEVSHATIILSVFVLFRLSRLVGYLYFLMICCVFPCWAKKNGVLVENEPLRFFYFTLLVIIELKIISFYGN